VLIETVTQEVASSSLVDPVVLKQLSARELSRAFCWRKLSLNLPLLKTLEPLWDDSRMGLRKEFVRLLANKVAVDLVEKEMIEVPAGLDLAEMVFQVMDEEINLEDRINEEVRVMLNQYQDQMRLSGASYQEMFKLIKGKLVKERKIVL
jgi:hypothetical protein